MGEMAEYDMEQWLENYYGFEVDEEIYWTMRDGTRIQYKKMETSHIINCIGMMERKHTPYDLEYDVRYKALWKELESKRRVGAI